MTQREERVLKFVNRLRKEIGLPVIAQLVPGKKADPCGCPIARSLVFGSSCRSRVVYNKVILTYPDLSKPAIEIMGTPQYINDFIKKFDAGGYEHLQEREYIVD